MSAAEKRPRTFVVMVVEDRKDQAHLFGAVLSSQGYLVISVADGFNAKELMRAGMIPDVLITDINMPKLSGFELMAELKDLNLKIPTIVTSGVQEISNFEEAYLLGARSYLMKPFSPDQLLKQVERMLPRDN